MPETRSPSPAEEYEKDAKSVQQRSFTSSEAEKIGAELKNFSEKPGKLQEMCGPLTDKNGTVEESLDPKKDRKIERENKKGINEDDVEFEREENPKEEGETEEGSDPDAPSSSTAQPQANNFSNLLNNRELELNPSTLPSESSRVEIADDADTQHAKCSFCHFLLNLCHCVKKTVEITNKLSRSNSIHPGTEESEV